MILLPFRSLPFIYYYYCGKIDREKLFDLYDDVECTCYLSAVSWIYHFLFILYLWLFTIYNIVTSKDSIVISVFILALIVF